MKVFANISKKLTPNFNELISSISKVAQLWSDYLSTYEKAKLIAVKHNWFIASELTFDKSTLNRIIELDSSTGEDLTASIDSELLSIYNKDVLLEICSDMKSHELLKSKTTILEEIKIALEMELHYLVITALYPLIEGVIVTGYKHTGRFNGGHFKQYTKDLLNHSFHESLKEIILGSILVQFEHGSEIESNLSRNAVLHGASNDYGSRVNSTKLLLVLYELIRAFDIKFRKV